MAQSSVPSRSSAYSIWWQQTLKSDGVLLRALDLARASEAREDVPVPSLPPTTLSLPPLITPFAMSLHDVKTAADFDAHLASSEFAACHFWASWCEPCGAMDQLMLELAATHPNVRFLRVEAEEVDELAERFDVSAVPFFTFHAKTRLVDRLEGADAAALAERVHRHFASSSSAPAPVGAAPAAAPPAASAAEDLDARLRALVTRAPVMLFMKGTRDEPRCGFSRKVVAALAETGVPFDTFDILSDEDVRQGLKTFSNWPTYPQLYAGGELVGGCDIILEMAANGELAEALSSAADASKTALDDRLRALVTHAPVMLFMKGTRDEPRCGFSRKVVGALADAGVAFETFDILSDEEVRQGLKSFSDWPTYPQLYHRGELLGGCDIILEMAANGELAQALAA